MAKNNNLTDFLTDIADAIREQTGGATEKINPQEFADRIRSLPIRGEIDHEWHIFYDDTDPASLYGGTWEAETRYMLARRIAGNVGGSTQPGQANYFLLTDLDVKDGQIIDCRVNAEYRVSESGTEMRVNLFYSQNGSTSSRVQLGQVLGDMNAGGGLYVAGSVVSSDNSTAKVEINMYGYSQGVREIDATYEIFVYEPYKLWRRIS